MENLNQFRPEVNSQRWLDISDLPNEVCDEPVTIDTKEGLEIVNIDSCEYIKCPTYGINSYVYSHKGNCRFCKERRQKELKELVEQVVKTRQANPGH